MSGRLERAAFYTACALPGVGLMIATIKTIEAVSQDASRVRSR